MIVTTAQEIRIIEEKENEVGTKFLRLMELAGTGCAKIIAGDYAPEEGPVTVVVGNGKNGGDGFVISRKLKEWGYDVTVVLAFGEPKADDAIINCERAVQADVPVVSFSDDKEEALDLINNARVLVDCMFGIGFRGAANEVQAEVFEALNESPADVVAVDVPSGTVTDTGEVLGSAVKADKTIAISTLKPLHVRYPAREYCGEVVILDIGITKEAFDSVTTSLFTLTKEEADALLPAKGRTTHKNDAGHLLSVCGSYRMPGAACLCASAAVRAGAGLVTAAYPASAYPAISSHLTECMSLPLPETPKGQLSTAALPELKEALKKASVLAAGPGLGQCEELITVLGDLLEAADEAGIPVVLDADGLNNASNRSRILKNHRSPLVITPHPGEMARLTGEDVASVQRDRVKSAKSFADSFGVTVLLKGPDTIVASPDRDDVYINTSGNQGLAKGGSGDTLTGILAAFLAQGVEPFEAACLAAFYHGFAAEECAKTKALRTILASDLIDVLPKILP